MSKYIVASEAREFEDLKEAWDYLFTQAEKNKTTCQIIETGNATCKAWMTPSVAPLTAPSTAVPAKKIIHGGDPEAPHGRDANGIALAPYGLTKAGLPSKRPQWSTKKKN